MNKLITLVLLSPIAFVLAIVYAGSYSGEVIELATYDERGGAYETSLWIVDLYGDQWLRAGNPEATWLQRIKRHPEVHVTRYGMREEYEAEVVDDFADRINGGMREKYGWADELLAILHDEEEVVAIRLLRP